MSVHLYDWRPYLDIDAGLRASFELLFGGGHGRGRIVVIIGGRGGRFPGGHGWYTMIEKGIPLYIIVGRVEGIDAKEERGRWRREARGGGVDYKKLERLGLTRDNAPM